MAGFEYRVIPAPRRGIKAKGAKSAEERFAAALAAAINAEAAAGWDYLRSETLASEERQGLTGRTTVYHAMLVFRRALAEVAVPAPVPVLAPPAPAPVAAPPVAAPPVATPEPEPPTAPETPAERG